MDDQRATEALPSKLSAEPSQMTRDSPASLGLSELPTANEFADNKATTRQSGEEQKDLVILVHGINTRAQWMGEIKETLQRAGFVVAPTSYGRFGVPRFLAPFPRLRKKAIERVVKDIRTAIRVYKIEAGINPTNLSIISHSFGTYVVGKILTDYPEFYWHRIIFCGSVIRDDFPFDQVLERFSPPLLNEVGTRDYWPALAESVGWGYGSVGSNGFNRPPVETRWHRQFRHSDFLTEKFAVEFWVPFLKGEKPKFSDKHAELPFWIRVISSLPLRLIPPSVLAATLLWFAAVPIRNLFIQTPTHYEVASDKSSEVVYPFRCRSVDLSTLSIEEYSRCNP